MKNGQIVYFYYDNVIPCQKGRIQEIGEGWCKVSWLNDDNKSTGSSCVPNERIFESEESCIFYSNALRDEVKSTLRNSLSTTKDILEYMYGSIYSDSYDWSAEKEVLKEKIKELFGIEINK